jgi:hypothetical protein
MARELMIYSSVDAAGVLRVRHECKQRTQSRLKICPLRHEILLD